MNELTVNFEAQTMSARELHERLEIGTPFTMWFDRMCEYGFSEGTDFLTKMLESTGGRPSVDYEISIDMAKQICMLQRTEQGKAIRQYLIDLEKAWNTPEQVYARALEMAHRTIEDFKMQRLADMPKIQYFDDLVDRNLLTNFKFTAQELHMGQKDFINWLLAKKFIYRDQKGKLRGYAPYMVSKDNPKGYFDIKDYTNQKSNHAGNQTLITVFGKEAFRILLERERKNEVLA